ncbi:MAG: phosphoglucosamine mutase [Clostridia bacterium]|nr:phosphoglucosamine mutase [Clostridia bacterium]
MGEYFGTDGFRGEVNVTLTAKHAYEIGRYIGRFVAMQKGYERGKVVIGKDPRRSSYMYEYALSAGLTASGADAYLLHVTTTPSVSYITRTEGFSCGVMISASHNPYTDNGIKIFDENGGKADEELINGVEQHLKNVEKGVENLPYAKGGCVGKTVDFRAGRNRYIGYLISLSKSSFSDLKIGLDCAEGSAFFIAKSVFDALGAITVPIHVTPNGENINLRCGSTCPEELCALVKEKGLDMGFAFDGDGDRCICVDERGQIRDGDCVLYASAKHGLCERHQKTVVATAMSNGALAHALKAIGVETAYSKVGDRYVFEKMEELGAMLGGEQSGHIIFKRHANTGDGILTAIKMTELAVEKECKFSELFDGLTMYPQSQKNVTVGHKKEILKSVKLESVLYECEELLKKYQGRLFVRPSGTEEKIRILTECTSGTLCEETAKRIEDTILALDGQGDGAKR